MPFSPQPSLHGRRLGNHGVLSVGRLEIKLVDTVTVFSVRFGLFPFLAACTDPDMHASVGSSSIS
jgi:hypothetical protein